VAPENGRAGVLLRPAGTQARSVEMAGGHGQRRTRLCESASRWTRPTEQGRGDLHTATKARADPAQQQQVATFMPLALDCAPFRASNSRLSLADVRLSPSLADSVSSCARSRLLTNKNCVGASQRLQVISNTCTQEATCATTASSTACQVLVVRLDNSRERCF
jgi:hypothetical protein